MQKCATGNSKNFLCNYTSEFDESSKTRKDCPRKYKKRFLKSEKNFIASSLFWRKLSKKMGSIFFI